ncbi:MAG TPA: DUF3500 domain-containing protein [Cyclobacteriaceae bacterium]
MSPSTAKICAISLITIITLEITHAQGTVSDRFERFKKMSLESEMQGLKDPFHGIATGEGIEKGLYKIQSTGVSIASVIKAANNFLSTLTPEQKSKTKFGIDDDEWRKWMNQHFYIRQGVGFNEMTESQRKAAFGLISAGLSAKGLKLTQDIMKLNHTLGELNNNFIEYGEWLYWITIMGEPSATEPWGWQIDGHHVIINYFVLGDQVVMTPMFVGSEPVIAEAGKYKGIAIMQEEQNQGLSMLEALDASQQKEAILKSSKDNHNNLTEAFKDNVVLDYAGFKLDKLSQSQKKQMLKLIQLYIDNMDKGHAKIRLDEIENHLNDTYFAWMGGATDQSVYYYRIHSPVLLIEFDHQSPAGLGHIYPRDKPTRQHIHAVVRTPNGNDYGKDLLRQHYEQHPH